MNIPRRRYNHRPLPNRRLSTDTSTLNFSALVNSSASRLLIQHAQPQSSETHSSKLVPQSYVTSGVDTASLISSEVQTAYLSGNLFSEVLVPTPVQHTVRLPEYFTSDNSRPPTPNFADYPLRFDGITIYESRPDPRFTLFAQRFINNKDTLSEKRKELELKRFQHPNLGLKFEVKIRFQGLNPYPVFQVAKLEHKATPAPFIVTDVDSNRDRTLPDLTYGKIMIYNPYSGLKYTTHYIILKHICSPTIYK